jgi:hypothetical protein
VGAHVRETWMLVCHSQTEATPQQMSGSINGIALHNHSRVANCTVPSHLYSSTVQYCTSLKSRGFERFFRFWRGRYSHPYPSGYRPASTVLALSPSRRQHKSTASRFFSQHFPPIFPDVPRWPSRVFPRRMKYRESRPIPG